MAGMTKKELNIEIAKAKKALKKAGFRIREFYSGAIGDLTTEYSNGNSTTASLWSVEVFDGFGKVYDDSGIYSDSLKSLIESIFDTENNLTMILNLFNSKSFRITSWN
jgi:hypothetical protein